MLTPSCILVPVDFSETSERALDYAIGLSGKLGASIYLLHVIGVPALGVPELGVAMTSTVIDSLVRDSQNALDKLLASRREQAKFGDPLLRTGDPRDTILHAAEEVKADLIVMGTHGRRGISRALIGSVAEAVVRMSPVPVLTIRGKK